MSDHHNYIFEQVSKKHYPFLQQLFLNAFLQHIPLGEIERRYNTTALGAPQIGFIALDAESGEPAAHFGVLPLKIINKGRILLAAQNADVMTHSKHRKRGLFTKLSGFTCSLSREQGMELLYSSPNKYSYHGLVHSSKWAHLEDIIRYDLKLKIKTFPLPKIVLKSNFLFEKYLIYAKWVLKKLVVDPPAEFTNQLLIEVPRVYRNSAHINYKSGTNKLFIKIDEVIFWIKLADVIWIGDIDHYEKVTVTVIQKLKKLAFKLGYNSIVFNLNENIPLPESFKEFKAFSKDAACYQVFNPELNFKSMIWTGADFDTW